MRRRLSAAVFSTALLLASHGTPAPAAQPVLNTQQAAAATAADPEAALQQRVTDLVNDPSVSAGTWGISIRSLSTSLPLAAVNDTRLLTPASTLKIFTLAVAADQLGWDYTFQTRVVMTGAVENGVLEGDLVVIGSGDPSLDDWDGAAASVFRTWADRLRELGVDAIDGRVIGDDRAFSDSGLGRGWAWDDLAFSYSAPASALQFNQNSVQVLAEPGPSVGLPAVVSVIPPYASVALERDVGTDVRGAAPILLVRPRPRDGSVEVSGTVPLGGPRLVGTIAVNNPTLYYAQAVREGLRAAGIDVRGEAVDVGDLAGTPDLDRATTVLSHRSPPLSSLADTMMKLSQNLYAETLLRTLGLARAGTGTIDAGLEVEREVLSGWGIRPEEAIVVDGSGLSRYNLVTSGAMVAVLAHVYADDRLRDPFLAALPVAGRSGTLERRLRGTAAEGSVRAKTGSFSNARAIGGFARTAQGEPLAFSIVANNYGVEPAAVDRIADAVIAAVSAFSR